MQYFSQCMKKMQILRISMLKPFERFFKKKAQRIDLAAENIIFVQAWDEILQSAFFKRMTENKDKKQYSNIVMVTDENVAAFYTESFFVALENQLRINSHLLILPPGENTKSREMKAFVEDRLSEIGCSRDTLLLAFGGGVILDLTGFIAATYYRGVSVIYIPTSLLAMVDASIGGKTGINTAYGKNLIGTFTLPQKIFIYTGALYSLPDSEYLSAFSEVFKHALIADKDYFLYIQNHWEAILKREPVVLTSIVRRSCEIKALVVCADQKEAGYREILNFGHSIAHAIEQLSDYRISHAYAVAIGIVVEAFLSYQLNLLFKDAFEDIEKCMRLILQSTAFDFSFTKQAFYAALKRDKKVRNNHIRFVLLSAIGQVYVHEGEYAHTVSDSILELAIDFCLSWNFKI